MRKEVTYVIGHKNPDTDSICSAIAVAEMKAAEGEKNVVAARSGDINPQTSFILDYFNVPSPRYLADVYPKAKDIMSTDVVVVTEGTPLLKVMEIMREQKIRFIPVLDKAGKPSGVLTLMDVAKRYSVKIEAESSREVFTSLRNIAETLKAKVILDYLGEAENVFSVYVGAMAEDSFRYILGGDNPRQCAVIVGDRDDIQKIAVEKGVGVLIISGGFSVEPSLIEAAKKNNVSIIISPYDSATTAQLVRLSTPAYKICDNEFEKCGPDELADSLKHRAANTSGIVVMDDSGLMKGVITKSNLLLSSGTSLILVDHNEMTQSVDGAENVSIVEVIDHHRMGNFHTPHPITFICEPVGSTSTLVAELYRRKGLFIRKEVAGLLLGGVLSDTVILKSPTTTERDKDIVKWLEEKSGLDHKAFGSEIFGATSSLKNRGPEAAVNGDYKIFDAKGKSFGVGQVETIGFEEFYSEVDKLKAELVKLKEKKGLYLSALLVTDIVLGTSLLLAIGEKELIYKLDYPKLDESVYELKNVISRKKQVLPHIISIFNQVY